MSRSAPQVQKWTPPEPTLETCHDVRRLSECGICHTLGIDLIRGLFKGSLVAEWKALGIPFSRIDKAYEAAVKREAASRGSQ